MDIYNKVGRYSRVVLTSELRFKQMEMAKGDVNSKVGIAEGKNVLKRTNIYCGKIKEKII